MWLVRWNTRKKLLHFLIKNLKSLQSVYNHQNSSLNCKLSLLSLNCCYKFALFLCLKDYSWQTLMCYELSTRCKNSLQSFSTHSTLDDETTNESWKLLTVHCSEALEKHLLRNCEQFQKNHKWKVSEAFVWVN